jgi:metal-dependent HD superfamily phosphatase/phosphodiesterase
MIKAESNQGKMEVELEGTVGEIIAETSAMLHCIYNALHEDTREMFAVVIRQNTAPGGLCWMTREQRREKAAKMLRELLDKVEGEGEEPEGLGMRFEGEPVKADGDCSLEEMTRNAARMAMEKKEA